ncbi:MAG TPA: hypothetical protein VF267_08745 [Gammaproteobacteria bacterium]
MKGCVLAFLMCMSIPGVVHADDTPWSLSIEFPGGPFIEYRFADRHALAFTYSDWVERAGDGDAPLFRNHVTSTGLRYLLFNDNGNHRSELGIALLYVDENLRLPGQPEIFSGHELAARLYAGYRYEPRGGGFQLRAGLTAYRGIADQDAHQLADDTLENFPWPYLSVGWRF